jgi:aspartate kinase
LSPRPIVVQKYGGSSVATVEKLRRVADLVVSKQREGFDLVVVVSAMGDTTDALLAQAREVSPEPDRRELDMLLSVGERISMSLLAMAIRERGASAVSLTGSQSGIITTASHANARIMEVRPFRIQDELEAGRVVIVAGYQGVSYRREVTTLGRGGSDTTAVALAAALDAAACEIYSDVPGVFTADPRVVADATKLDALGYEEMQELAASGARVLNATAVEFAKTRGIAIYARKTGASDAGTVIRRDIPTPTSGVRGLAHERSVGLLWAPTGGGRSVRGVLSALEDLELTPKQVSWVGDRLSIVLGLDDIHELGALERLAEAAGGGLRTDLGAVSLIGEGIGRDPRLLARALSELEAGGWTAEAGSTSRFRVTVLLPSGQVEAAVRRLHAAFELGHPSADARVP